MNSARWSAFYKLRGARSLAIHWLSRVRFCNWVFFERLGPALVFAGQDRVICLLHTELSTDTVHNCVAPLQVRRSRTEWLAENTRCCADCEEMNTDPSIMAPFIRSFLIRSDSSDGAFTGKHDVFSALDSGSDLLWSVLCAAGAGGKVFPVAAASSAAPAGDRRG